MNNNLFQTEYDITQKTKLRRFYENNKVKIILLSLLSVIMIISFFFYLEVKKNKKITLTENYISAKIYIENGNKNEAIKSLVKIIPIILHFSFL
jgi:predicted negative regulator of RcsB-dependent stress response